VKQVFFVILFLICSSTANAQINAFYNKNHVDISWSHSDIRNINYFVIEKSKNGKYFKPFLKVTNSNNAYSSFLEIDNKPYKHVTYYRIRYVNKKGAYYYSETVAARKYLNKKLKPELVSYDKLNILVILKDINGKVFYAKVNIKENDNQLTSETLNKKLSTGQYLIIGSEDDILLGNKLNIINQERSDFNSFSDTLNIK